MTNLIGIETSDARLHRFAQITLHCSRTELLCDPLAEGELYLKLSSDLIRVIETFVEKNFASDALCEGNDGMNSLNAVSFLEEGQSRGNNNTTFGVSKRQLTAAVRP